ncbi:uncharacterized protein LOC109196116 isoform X3 [Oreochromis niloticus]|uniref:uncharacterized protein LOC109196116 isoform X3 n=1 Tax=Oreochromis niloticus TaxID=8128 RepID=UPI000673F832|nr:uncharacterized protein LOC109196116 isoform X3 [Oreochromis niloticus]
MKVCHTLVCFIILTQQDGRVNAETARHRKMEGEDITLECRFFIRGNRRLFCKQECEKGNILINTTADTFQSGRYSIEYVKKKIKYDIMYVSITQLKQSDSGRYKCFLDSTLKPDYFEIIVTEAVKTSTSGSTPKAFSSSAFLLSTSTTATTAATTTATTAATTTQSFNFSLESSTSSSSSTEILNHPETPAGPGADKPLYVILILVIMITLLSATLLIFYKKRKAIKPKGPPVETEYANITQNNRVCEEIRDGSSPPVEVSSADAYPKTCQRAGVENLELYSLITYSQSKAENDTDEVDYTEVDFSHMSVTNSALCGKSGDVVYSTPQIHASPRNHVKDASPPLYSIKPKLKN